MKRGYAFGVMLVLSGGVCLSISGILLRNVESADGWQLLFYRGVSFFITLFLIIFLRYRGRTLQAFHAVGTRGIWVALVLGAGSVCYVFAILLTTVANAVFIIGAAPLVTAIAGWLFLKEKITAAGVLAMLVAVAGIGLMFTDGFLAGRWLGNVMAVFVVLSFAAMLVLLRGARNVDMLPATCMAGLVAAAIAGFMAADLILSRNDLVIAILLGSVQFTGGFMFITIGTRYVPAAEVALFSLSEAVLAPIWVWIGVNEVPSVLTLCGALVVSAAVIIHSIVGIRRERAAALVGA
ncbi:MAG: DMT family transporter [Gammaproteobacteria bacterium]